MRCLMKNTKNRFKFNDDADNFSPKIKLIPLCFPKKLVTTEIRYCCYSNLSSFYLRLNIFYWRFLNWLSSFFLLISIYFLFYAFCKKIGLHNKLWFSWIRKNIGSICHLSRVSLSFNRVLLGLLTLFCLSFFHFLMIAQMQPSQPSSSGQSV